MRYLFTIVFAFAPPVAAMAPGFTPNLGQWPDPVLFRGCFEGSTAWFLEESGILIQSSESQDRGCWVPCSFVGASPGAVPEGIGILPHRSSFFLGGDPARWRTDVPVFASLRCREIYPGVDIAYRICGTMMKYDLVLRPGVDPGVIALRFPGAVSARITASGDLDVSSGGATLHQPAPVFYQDRCGERIRLEGGFRAVDDSTFGFTVEGMDPSLALLIDPSVDLLYSTYLGASGEDRSYSIAVDQSGRTYVTGRTSSVDFPLAGPFQGSYGGGDWDCFVSRFSADGSQLEYSTFIGGSGSDNGYGIDVDAGGGIVVAGPTGSSDFPVLNALQPSFGGGDSDAFVLRLSPGGTSLVFSTFLGGSGAELGRDVALDSGGNALVTGSTSSPDFPVASPFQGTYGGGDSDAFAASITPAGTELTFSTFLGGSGADYGEGVSDHASGTSYVTGQTFSTDFPVANAFQGAYGGGEGDGFLTRFSASGQQAVYSTYLGGSGMEVSSNVEAGEGGEAFLTGETGSADFPVANPYQGTLPGARAAFVTCLSSSGAQLLYSTYLGGSGNDQGRDIAVSQSGSAFICGYTSSVDFPVVEAWQGAYAGGSNDAFAAKLSPTGSSLEYSTYLGGSGNDSARGIALALNGSASVTGGIFSQDFPMVNAWQGTFGGGLTDCFVARLGPFGTGVETGPSPGPAPVLVSAAPNPCSGMLAVVISIPGQGMLDLGVYDLTGRRLAVLESAAASDGTHSYLWDPGDLPPGIYIVRASTDDGSTDSAMVVLLR